MTMEQRAGAAAPAGVTDAGWVSEVLLAGPDSDVCLRVPDPITRGQLRGLVADRRDRLTAAGLRAGGAAALRLPPSLAYVANLLAVWQLGAQAILLDYRLTDHEVEQARQRLRPQVMVAPHRVAGGLRVFFDVEDTVATCGSEPAPSEHAIIQLSSGSTGPSKVIGRTAADLIAEVRRYTQIDGVAAARRADHPAALDGARAGTGRRPAVRAARRGRAGPAAAADRRQHPGRDRASPRRRPPCWACRSTSAC